MKHITAGQSTITSFPIAIVVSEFNRDITRALQEGALGRLRTLGFKEEDITVIEVPGAVEIPVTAMHLAKKGNYSIIIALGAVIQGETDHYQLVCEQVSQGCQQVALTYGVPVIYEVLALKNEAQAWDRAGGKHGNKGVEAANCALAMYEILKQLD
ncbi:MAG: 6,7-dimethyl-8-ribityllumazine synthase [Legionellaceae bacterium]|nr:6,7-dimethyl-8-ribityllumazine synthase [Legionellaceae bacterium]